MASVAPPTSNAINALRSLLLSALRNDFKGPLAYLASGEAPIELRIHALYNPDAITQYNIVPGLMGVVLTMTMVMITALAMTRERERGTMENLLATPATASALSCCGSAKKAAATATAALAAAPQVAPPAAVAAPKSSCCGG